jgi:DNA-binding NarL/FixJ family response regulator
MKKLVVVVEDDEELREQIVEILRSAPDIQCAGAFDNGREALKRIPELIPDVVLMDIQLPGMSGIKCVEELRKKLPMLQIIMVTIYEDSEQIFAALRAGANGYLVKSSAPEKLLEAVRDVFQGGSPMSGPVARKVIQHFQAPDTEREEEVRLTAREEQVLGLITAGYRYHEIAVELGLGIETVRTYVKSIFKKLHVHNAAEAAGKRRAL